MKLFRYLPLWYHQRFGFLLFVLLTLGLPALALAPATRGLSLGAFDIRTWIGLLIVTFMHTICVWSSRLVILLVIHSGSRRFGLGAPSRKAVDFQFWGDIAVFTFPAILPILSLSVAWQSEGFGFIWFSKVAGAIAGAFLAFQFIHFLNITFRKVDCLIDRRFFPRKPRQEILDNCLLAHRKASVRYHRGPEDELSPLTAEELLRIPFGLERRLWNFKFIQRWKPYHFVVFALARTGCHFEKKFTSLIARTSKGHLVDLDDPSNRPATSAERRSLPFLGFLDSTEARIFLGHRYIFAFTSGAFSLVFLFGFLSTLYDLFPSNAFTQLFQFPSLLFLSLLLTCLFLTFSLLAFLLDLYRVPLTAALITLLFITSQVPHNHFDFESKNNATIQPFSPSEVLATWQEQNRTGNPSDPTPIFIAVEGGGIQSGAWATHLLSALELKLRKENYDFSRSVVCTSGVSGGAYGLMYWIDSYGRHQPDAIPPYGVPTDSQALFASSRGRAMRSSLNPTIRGFLYGDLLVNAPGLGALPFRNRAEKMEAAWGRGYRVRGAPGEQARQYHKGLSGVMLSDWILDVRKGKRPVFLASTTNLDSGQRLVFGSSSLGSATVEGVEESATATNHYFRDAWPQMDLPVTTTARLSATFPFVSPASQSIHEPSGGHFGDGGYFDNSGVLTLIDWLKSGLAFYDTENTQKNRLAKKTIPREMIIIRIQAFPSAPQKEISDGTSSDGALYQMLAPLKGLSSIRGSVQRVNANNSLNSLIALAASKEIDIHQVTFSYPHEDAPLSWHLTRQDMNRIASTTWLTSEQEKNSELQADDVSATSWSPLLLSGARTQADLPTISDQPPHLLSPGKAEYWQLNQSWQKLRKLLGLSP